jgi:large subunit ribosomal protein L29
VKATELRSLSLADLQGELAEQYRAYFNLRFREAAGEDIGSAEMKKARREIARMKTIITEKQRPTGQQAAQEKS